MQPTPLVTVNFLGNEICILVNFACLIKIVSHPYRVTAIVLNSKNKICYGKAVATFSKLCITEMDHPTICSLSLEKVFYFICILLILGGLEFHH